MNQIGYNKDIQLEINFTRTIKQILGLHFFTQNRFEDIKNATDFLILKSNPIKVGCRSRRFSYYKNECYKKQFTIRWSRPSGVKTEIHKIKMGLVSHLFYGFANQHENKILQYFIGNFEIFRNHYVNPCGVYLNKPPDSEFAVWNLNQFPSIFIEKSYGFTDDIQQVKKVKSESIEQRLKKILHINPTQKEFDF